MRRQATALQAYLAALSSEKRHSQEFLSNLAYTLSTRRSLLNWRAFAVTDSVSSAATALSDSLSPSTFSIPSKAPVLNFVFTGQGAQYARMGLGLLQYPAFKQSLEDCDSNLASLGCSWSVISL